MAATPREGYSVRAVDADVGHTQIKSAYVTQPPTATHKTVELGLCHCISTRTQGAPAGNTKMSPCTVRKFIKLSAVI